MAGAPPVHSRLLSTKCMHASAKRISRKRQDRTAPRFIPGAGIKYCRAQSFQYVRWFNSFVGCGEGIRATQAPARLAGWRARRGSGRHGGGRVRGNDDKLRFTTMVLPHLGDAYALARSLTGNRVDAEDVVQEACLRAFRAIGGTAVGNARAWVLTIVHNTANTWLSKNRSASFVVVDDLEAVERTQADPARAEADTPNPS